MIDQKDIAHPVFLASDAANVISGQGILIDNAGGA